MEKQISFTEEDIIAAIEKSVESIHQGYKEGHIERLQEDESFTETIVNVSLGTIVTLVSYLYNMDDEAIHSLSEGVVNEWLKHISEDEEDEGC